VRNKLTKFGANPTIFEPLITGSKIIGSELPNLDRFPFFFFLLSSHAVRMEARVFTFMLFKKQFNC
jgi:hypothetical protein